MTVSKTIASSKGITWIHLSGTISEVLTALAQENASALNVPYYSDDGSNAKAVMCRNE